MLKIGPSRPCPHQVLKTGLTRDASMIDLRLVFHLWPSSLCCSAVQETKCVVSPNKMKDNRHISCENWWSSAKDLRRKVAFFWSKHLRLKRKLKKWVLRCMLIKIYTRKVQAVTQNLGLMIPAAGWAMKRREIVSEWPQHMHCCAFVQICVASGERVALTQGLFVSSVGLLPEPLIWSGGPHSKGINFWWIG